MNQHNEGRRRFLSRAAAIAAPALGCVARASSLQGGRSMPDVDADVVWINSVPLSSKSLRGKVVLINFWTYSCINSLRELPYMKAWHARYKDAGLVLAGVHSPEFAFEKDPANVRNAVSALKIPYAVAIDSQHSIWRAFRNHYWPANYMIDAKGRIRYYRFGEGEYVKSERVIQALLRENGATSLEETAVQISAHGAEAPPSEHVRSPETYLGYARAENFASLERMSGDSRKTYSPPVRLSLNQWALGGEWKAEAESSALLSAPGKILFRFHSRDLHMVLGPAKAGTPIRYRVKLNGQPPGDDHGSDCRADGTGELREARMYQLVRQSKSIQDATFEIDFGDPGVQAYSVTFG